MITAEVRASDEPLTSGQVVKVAEAVRILNSRLAGSKAAVSFPNEGKAKADPDRYYSDDESFSLVLTILLGLEEKEVLRQTDFHVKLSTGKDRQGKFVDIKWILHEFRKGTKRGIEAGVLVAQRVLDVNADADFGPETLKAAALKLGISLSDDNGSRETVEPCQKEIEERLSIYLAELNLLEEGMIIPFSSFSDRIGLSIGDIQETIFTHLGQSFVNFQESEGIAGLTRSVSGPYLRKKEQLKKYLNSCWLTMNTFWFHPLYLE